MNSQGLNAVRYLVRFISSLMLGMAVNSAHAETLPAINNEPSADERAFMQQAIIQSIKQSAEYQRQRQDCDELEQQKTDSIDCTVFKTALKDLDFLFQVGALSETHHKDIAAITSFCLYSGTGCYQWHLFVFLRQADGSLILQDRTALLSRRGGIHDFKIKDKAIYLFTFDIGKNDPGCCPSVKRSFKYSIHNGKLVEQKVHPN